MKEDGKIRRKSDTGCTQFSTVNGHVITDYSHCGLPAGSSDDICWVHIWERHIRGVEEGAVVCIVLTQVPLSGIFYHLLTFQLQNAKVHQTMLLA